MMGSQAPEIARRMDRRHAALVRWTEHLVQDLVQRRRTALTACSRRREAFG